MANATPIGHVVPNDRIPKVLGILNILFASGLMLCVLCSSTYIMMLPALGSMTDAMQKKGQAESEAKQKARVQGLKEAEAASKSDSEKAELKAQRLAIESAPKPAIPVMDFKKMGMDDPRWVGYVWADLISALLVNLLMLIAGIGLVQLKSWGRVLGLWTAVLKIARLVLIYSFMILVVAPFVSRKMGEMAAEMVVQQQQAMGRPAGAAPQTRDLVRIYNIFSTVMGVGMIVFGSIYPVISIWLLTRPGAVAACSSAKPAREPNESW